MSRAIVLFARSGSFRAYLLHRPHIHCRMLPAGQRTVQNLESRRPIQSAGRLQRAVRLQIAPPVMLPPQTPTPFPTIVVLIRARADPLQHTVSAVRTYLPTPATQRHRPRRRQRRPHRDRACHKRSCRGQRHRNYPPRNRSRRRHRHHLRNRGHVESQTAQPQPNTPPVVPIPRNTPPTDPAAGRSMRCPADPAPHPPDSGGSAQPSPRHRQA